MGTEKHMIHSGQHTPRPQTGLVVDDIFLKHFKQPEHPESPVRLLAIESELRRRGLIDRVKLVPVRLGTPEELTLAHDLEYVERVRDACASQSYPIHFDGAWMCPSTYEVAASAVGTSIDLATAVATGELANGFSLVRPPGHHAERDRYSGFCYFCTPAIVALNLVENIGIKRVFLLDLDYHGGNGTQHALSSDPRVYYCSIHGDPKFAFPHDSGYKSERGEGAGFGFTKNVPLPADTDDAMYLAAFDEEVMPVFKAYDPEIVLLSMGFDLLKEDPIGRFNVSSEALLRVTEKVCQIAREHCGGRVVSILEGGYNPGVMALAVADHVDLLLKS